MLVHVRERRPRADLSGLERDVDRLFRSFFTDWGVPTRSDSGFAVSEDPEGVTLRSEVPGVDPATIKIDVDGRTLTIAGERQREERRDGVYQLRERRSGDFSHTFHLTDRLDPEAITAECRHGILTVRIAKRAEAKPRQIEVKTN